MSLRQKPWGSHHVPPPPSSRQTIPVTIFILTEINFHARSQKNGHLAQGNALHDLESALATENREVPPWKSPGCRSANLPLSGFFSSFCVLVQSLYAFAFANVRWPTAPFPIHMALDDLELVVRRSLCMRSL